MKDIAKNFLSETLQGPFCWNNHETLNDSTVFLVMLKYQVEEVPARANQPNEQKIPAKNELKGSFPIHIIYPN